MSRKRPNLSPAFALWVFLLLVANPEPTWGAWTNNPLTSIPVAPSAADQSSPAVVADGQGGAFIAFNDSRAGNSDVYLQRLTSAGNVAPGWPATGLAICGATGDQYEPVAISDGAGGVIVAWVDNRTTNSDIYAVRIGPTGARPAGWPLNGKQITTNIKNEYEVEIATDDRRGAFLAWTLEFTVGTDLDVYAGRVDSAGTITFTAAVSAPAFRQYEPAVAADGTGGVLIAFTDEIGGNADVKAARISSTGSFIYGPVAAGTGLSEQFQPQVTGDGAGRAITVWQDSRGSFDIYATILNASGVREPPLSTEGTPICSALRTQWKFHVVSDRSGGAYIAWEDERSTIWRVFLHRFLATGITAPGWPTDGIELYPFGGIGEQKLGNVTSDAAGAAMVAWRDNRVPVTFDIYCQRILPTGILAPGWIAGGVPLTLGHAGSGANLAVDSGGNAIVSWADGWFAPFRLVAQKVDVFGQLGNPEPAISAVRDVIGDQGGRVRIDWTASYLDVSSMFGVGSYWIWRQAPAAQAALALARGARLLGDEDSATIPGAHDQDHGLWTTTMSGATTIFWEFLASLPASTLPAYSYVASTTTDSTGGANPLTPFMVQARAPSGPAFWPSAPVSGYSVDNLAPSIPSPFTGVFAGGATHLHWGANTEPDLAGYRLHRGNAANFVPSPGNLLSAQPDTGFADPGQPGSWYKLSAVDSHGNESPFAVFGPGGMVDVPGDIPGVLPIALALSAARPNPASGSIAMHLALPHEGPVRSVAYDARGRQVRTLLDRTLPAGEHDIVWDLADARGRRVPSGRYFVRVEAENRILVDPVTVVR